MLVFNRPEFRSGVMVVKVEVAGVPFQYILRPSDKGTTVHFTDDAAIKEALLAKYPGFLSLPV